jgi:hypothetical protein
MATLLQINVVVIQAMVLLLRDWVSGYSVNGPQSEITVLKTIPIWGLCLFTHTKLILGSKTWLRLVVECNKNLFISSSPAQTTSEADRLHIHLEACSRMLVKQSTLGWVRLRKRGFQI